MHNTSIFFVDPLTPMPHDVDGKALMRLAIVYDIPMALNRATAEIVLNFVASKENAA
jgi:methylglyoxal synthase